MWRYNKNQRGFSLLEVIVSLGIITVGIVGVLTLLAQGSRALRGADNSLIAAQLAQEGVELVVNVRNTNWILNRAWNTGLTDTTSGIISYNGTSVTGNASITEQCLGINANGYYQHNTAPCGRYSRRIEIRSLSDDMGVPYMEVRSIVLWQEGEIARSINVVDHLYDWR